MILVLLSLGAGDLKSGFASVRVEIRKPFDSFEEKLTASLPPAPELSELYWTWKQEYLNLMSLSVAKPRIQVLPTGITHGSDHNFQESCEEIGLKLNHWLNTPSFAAVEKRLRTKLSTQDEILVLVDTEDETLQRLPWHLWNFWQDYPHVEIGLSASEYTCVSRSHPRGTQVRILAVLGNSDGIDVSSDRASLRNLLNAEVEFLVEPDSQTFNQALWDEKGWDILFFAGHSNTDQRRGYLKINSTPSGNISIETLKYALRNSCSKGLQLGIFNSCDGIGLAANLADLNIPQTIFMRELVPDQVAQEFLKLLLPSYRQGKSLVSSLREAREKLYSLEPRFLCASWLPLLYQNPSACPKQWSDLGRPLILGDQSPYLGLLAFTEKEAVFFKGRETLTEQLYRAVVAKPLTAVVGASGSGKSSLVFAGLVPHLRQQGNWAIVDFRPGKNPMISLVAALSEFVDKNINAANLADKPDLLHTLLTKYFTEQVDRRLLLIINQFEEIYSLCEDVKVREFFLQQLLDALRKLPNFKIVITLRADFIQEAISYRPLADALQYADIKVSPMNRKELKEAIILPAQLMGVSLEKGLVDRLLNDVGDEPSNLALLEFTLTQLWEKRHDQTLTYQAYEEIGGLKQALSNYADQIYNELSTEEKKVAQQIFIVLVRVNEESEPSRRQVNKQDLLNFSQYEATLVLDKLAQAKLVVIRSLETKTQTTIVVDLAHEALIHHWHLLHNWVEINRDNLRLAQRLETEAKQWREKTKVYSQEFLLKGYRLREAKDFVAKWGNTIALSKNVYEFIEISKKQTNRSRLIKWTSIGITTASVITGLFMLGFLRYHRYWNGTIQRIQTVDFNILSHLLPYKLSVALLKQDEQEIQKIINSNYGLSGIVVTNCTEETKECVNQNILYITRSKRDWKQNLTTEELINHPYDILRDPPPFATENVYPSPRQLDRQPTGKLNPGKIIGRVYYIRQPPPTFTESLFHFLF